MTKTIVILNWRCPKNPLSGGAELVTLQHAKAWVQAGYKVTWVTGGFTGCKAEEIMDGVRIIRRGNSKTIYFIAPFVCIFTLKKKYDLLIDQIHGLPFFTPLWAPKTNKLTYIHEVAQEIWDQMFPFPLNIIGKTVEKMYLLFYKHVPFLTGSQSTKDDLIRYGIPQQNITIIPHGLFIPIADHVHEKEKELTVLFVSRLVKMKGIEECLSVFSLIHKQMPNSKLWVVGNGEKNYKTFLVNLAKKLHINDATVFFGFIPDKEKIALYQKAHFLVHTSVREGFGLVVIEANSQGTPAVVYDSAGLRDLVKNNINGAVYSRSQKKEMADSIITLYNDQKNYLKLCESSIEYAKQYDWASITAQSTRLIKKLLQIHA